MVLPDVLSMNYAREDISKCLCSPEREFFIDNLLVRIHFIIVMIRWSGLAPWEFEFPFPGSLTSTFLVCSPLCDSGCGFSPGQGVRFSSAMRTEQISQSRPYSQRNTPHLSNFHVEPPK